MAFENFFRRDRGREGGERNRGASRQDWHEGGDYYGNRDGRRNYGLGDRSAEDHGRVYRLDYGGSDWGNEGRSYGGEFSAGSYTRGDFGASSDDHSTRGSFGEGGYGRDLDYGRRGALGYGGYGGMGGAETGSSAYGYGTRKESYQGRGPRGYRRSDERIREDVCEMLTEDPYLDASNMEVRVEKGEVTLTGSVGSREDKRRAEDLIERIPGVQDVHNHLRIMSEQGAAREGATAAQGTQAGQVGQAPRH